MKMFVMTGKFIFLILVMAVSASISIFVVGCGEVDDEEEEETDPGDANAISSVLVIPDAREREGDPPPPSRSLSAPDVSDGLERVNSLNGSTFLLPFRYETVQELLGYYIQIQDADVYFDVPYRGPSSTSGELVLTISIPTNVREGSFTVVYCVYDAQGRVSNIIRTTIEVVGVKKNNTPVIEAIPDQTLGVGDETRVAVNITDADLSDTHILRASSDDTAIATVAVNSTTLTITGIGGGVATITVSAADDSGQNNAKATPITFQVAVGCQIPPLDEDYRGTPIVFGVGNRGCVLLSDGNLVSVACFQNQLIVAGGQVLTSKRASVKFGGADLINERFELIPDGKLSEFEVGKPRSGTIKIQANGYGFVVDIPEQDFKTIKGDSDLIGYFFQVDGPCEVRPRLNRDLVEVLTGLAEDMIFIMRNNR